MVPAAAQLKSRYHELRLPISIFAGERDLVVSVDALADRRVQGRRLCSAHRLQAMGFARSSPPAGQHLCPRQRYRRHLVRRTRPPLARGLSRGALALPRAPACGLFLRPFLTEITATFNGYRHPSASRERSSVEPSHNAYDTRTTAKGTLLLREPPEVSCETGLRPIALRGTGEGTLLPARLGQICCVLRVMIRLSSLHYTLIGSDTCGRIGTSVFAYARRMSL